MDDDRADLLGEVGDRVAVFRDQSREPFEIAGDLRPEGLQQRAADGVRRDSEFVERLGHGGRGGCLLLGQRRADLANFGDVLLELCDALPDRRQKLEELLRHDLSERDGLVLLGVVLLEAGGHLLE